MTMPRTRGGSSSAAPAAAPPADTPVPFSTPTTRLALGGLVASTLAIAAAYGAALLPGDTPGWAAWAMGFGVPVALVSTVMLGAARAGHVPRPLQAAFVLVGVLLAGGFSLALALPPLGADEPLLLGLPRRAAIIIYGIGLLPIVVLPIAYALTFEAQTLRPEDLERVRAAARIAREAREAREDEAARDAATPGHARDRAAAGGAR